MGLARGRGRGRIIIAKGRGGLMKPPPLMGRLGPPPHDMMRPRGMPPVQHPGLLPRMRPPPPGMRSPRLLPPPPGPRRPPMPPPPPYCMPPHPPAGPRGLHNFPPAMPRPPMPMIRPRPGQRPPPPGLRPPHGAVPPMGPMGRLGRGGKRIGMPPKGKVTKTKKTNPGELQENELNKPWITEAMKNEIMKKHKLYQKAKKSNEENDWKEFKDQKTRVATMIREAKLEYIGNHPEEGKHFYCETCDREFKTESKLAEHIEQHSVCGRDGCQFVAHPKVIAKHVQMQHESGLFKKIGNIYTPEEITKWIADRKRMYPTKENVEKKKTVQEARTNRGERLNEDRSRFGRPFDRSRRQSVTFNTRRRRGTGPRGMARRHFNNERGQFHHNFSDSRPVQNRTQHRMNYPQNDVAASSRKLPAFPGTAAYSGSVSSDEDSNDVKEDVQISDSEWEAESTCMTEAAAPSILIPAACKALSSLMSSYASDATESEDDTEVTPTAVQKIEVVVESVVQKSDTCASSNGNSTSQTALLKKENGAETDSDSGPEEKPVLHKSTEVNSGGDVSAISTPLRSDESRHTNSRKRRRHHRPRSSKDARATKMKKPDNQQNLERKIKTTYAKERTLTFLEMLLTREIRHERNVILQCVRCVVQNNFFGTQSTINKEEKSKEETYGVLLQCIKHVVYNNFFTSDENMPSLVDEKVKVEEEPQSEV